MALSPFDIIGMVCAAKDPQWSDIEDKEYVPFIINRGLSQFPDTVMLANEVNFRHTMPKKWQFDFYKYAITPKKKRFAKWAKPEDDILIEQISEAFNVNRRRAMGIRSLMNEDAVKLFKEKTQRGGR